MVRETSRLPFPAAHRCTGALWDDERGIKAFDGPHDSAETALDWAMERCPEDGASYANLPSRFIQPSSTSRKTLNAQLVTMRRFINNPGEIQLSLNPFDGGNLLIMFDHYTASVEAFEPYAADLMVNSMRQTIAMDRAVHITMPDGFSIARSVNRNSELEDIIQEIDSRRATLNLTPRRYR